MSSLLTIFPLTIPLTGQVGPALQFASNNPRDLLVQFNFSYGTGGTSFDAWLQSSVDGSSWYDIANFHATTASMLRLINLSNLTPVLTAVTPGDGVLAANTAIDGIIGSKLRVKYTSVGTYATGTSVQISVTTARLMT